MKNIIYIEILLMDNGLFLYVDRINIKKSLWMKEEDNWKKKEGKESVTFEKWN